MHSKPGEFFKTFKPLLANGNESSGSNCILWNVTGSVAKEQNIVAEEFAGYCSTLANDNGGKIPGNVSGIKSKEYTGGSDCHWQWRNRMYKFIKTIRSPYR